MEEVWGNNFNIIMLTDQGVALEVNEMWMNPSGSPEYYLYSGCWFQSLGRNHSAQGDRITKVNASLMYVKKYRVI
jgi:hypothetical protein